MRYYICDNEMRATEQLSPRITQALARPLTLAGPADMFLRTWPAGLQRSDDIVTIQLHIRSADRLSPFVAHLAGVDFSEEP